MSKFQINLSNYPSLLNLYESDKQDFADTIKGLLVHADKSLKEERFKVSKDIYKMNYITMLNDIMDTFFDMEGIIKKHSISGERKALEGLKHNIHPLAIFTNNATVYNAKGEYVSVQQDDFDLKDWLYSLFYGARFVSWQELAEYLSLGEYDLIDVLKARNFEQLAFIQPALKFQEENNIPIGKLIKGTGLFDGGDITTQPLEECPACESKEWNTDNEKYAYCPECRLGGLK